MKINGQTIADTKIKATTIAHFHQHANLTKYKLSSGVIFCFVKMKYATLRNRTRSAQTQHKSVIKENAITVQDAATGKRRRRNHNS